MLRAIRAGSVVMLVMACWIDGVWREYPELKGLSLRTGRKACQALCASYAQLSPSFASHPETDGRSHVQEEKVTLYCFPFAAVVQCFRITLQRNFVFPSENVQDRPTEYTEKHGIFGLRVRHNHFIREIFATMPPIIGVSFPVIPVCPVV